VQAGRYAPASQMRRMRRELKWLKTYSGRVHRNVARRVARDEGLARRLADLPGPTERLQVQERTSNNELYSQHAPKVACIAKAESTGPTGSARKSGWR
jgi:transposase, IS5 family